MIDSLERGRKLAAELKLRRDGYTGLYYADDIHRLLGDGVEVFSEGATVNWWKKGSWPFPTGPDTTALLIAIRPIRRDTAESLLKEFVDEVFLTNINQLAEFQNRAKAYLECTRDSQSVEKNK